MNEQMIHDNQALLAFWDSFFALPEEAKEGARQEGIGPWEALAPSEKLLKAACALGAKKNVLDFGCGNGWAAIAAANSHPRRGLKARSSRPASATIDMTKTTANSLFIEA